jgi:hypothetical protein
MRKLDGFRADPTLKRGVGNHCAYGAGNSAECIAESPENHPAGAKAQPIFSASCGPTEVVPLLQSRPKPSIFAACEFVPCYRTDLLLERNKRGPGGLHYSRPGGQRYNFMRGGLAKANGGLETELLEIDLLQVFSTTIHTQPPPIFPLPAPIKERGVYQA